MFVILLLLWMVTMKMHIYTYIFKTEIDTYIPICQHHKQLFTREREMHLKDCTFLIRLTVYRLLYQTCTQSYVTYHILSKRSLFNINAPSPHVLGNGEASVINYWPLISIPIYISVCATFAYIMTEHWKLAESY